MSDQQAMTDIVSQIMKISDTKCLKTIAATARSRKDSLLEAETVALAKGDKVQLRPEHQHKKPYGAVGTITKVNPKRFKVDFGNFMNYTVPKTMMMPAE